MNVKIEIVKQLTDNYSYVIYNKISKTALVVDPAEYGKILDFINKNNV